MRVDTFHTARLLAGRPHPEDFAEPLRYARDVTHAGLPHVPFRITAEEGHRGPVHERFPLVWLSALNSPTSARAARAG